MEYHLDCRITDKVPEQVQVGNRLRIDERDDFGGRDLYQAKAREVGTLPNKLRVEGESPCQLQGMAKFG